MEWIEPGFFALREYLLTKLVGAFLPAFFIAGAVGAWVPKSFIVKYLSAGTKARVSYPSALIGGGLMSVCACGILPLFQTIYQRGAGIGPAITFLFAGPAINVIAILYTFQLLGPQMGVARLISVALLALVIGGMFSVFQQKEERKVAKMSLLESKESHNIKFLIVSLLMIMVFTLPLSGFDIMYKVSLNTGLLFLIVFCVNTYLTKEQREPWIEKSIFLLKNIVPKLLFGIFLVGVLTPHSKFIMTKYLIDNSLISCFVASLVGSVLYLGTIIGVVAVHGLSQMGMPQGPALSLLLSGPTIALPSMIVIMGVCGRKIGILFLLSVISLSTIAGYIYATL
ncbi:MAG: permease [Candidatus Cloacimonetes bacterium]|nr:permease [Candidatus Cloacimonadota bacterium]